MAKINLSAYRGDLVEFPFVFKDGNGVAIDITGWILFFTLKNNIDDSDNSAVLKVDVTSHTDPVNGKTEVILSNISTDSLAGEYFYDFQFKNNLGEIKTIMSGIFEFLKDVTRRTVPS